MIGRRAPTGFAVVDLAVVIDVIGILVAAAELGPSARHPDQLTLAPADYPCILTHGR